MIRMCNVSRQTNPFQGIRDFIQHLPPLVALISLTACSSLGLTSAVGPTRSEISQTPEKGALNGVRIIDVTDSVARDLRDARSRDSFAEKLSDARPVGTVVGVGDVLDITIWEAPPAALFSAGGLDSRSVSSAQVSRASTLPEFIVGPSGNISVPFAGQVVAAGRTLAQIEKDITTKLSGKAHQPQVMVRLARNATATVTVVGEVTNSTRLPLTPKGEKLLDALAAAGGTRQPVNKMTIQITRGSAVHSMPLRAVIRDPRQNITLQTDDVVTAIFQPFSFTVLGAAGRNAEVEFEETGITLAQAIGRIGGLQDMRADPKGVFLFRWEDPIFVEERAPPTSAQLDGRIPVIYRIDMQNPMTYFAAQNFEMRDRDVVFITNSPFAEFQRFVSIVTSTIIPAATVQNSLKN